MYVQFYCNFLAYFFFSCYQRILVDFSKEVGTFFGQREKEVGKDEKKGFVLGIKEVVEHLRDSLRGPDIGQSFRRVEEGDQLGYDPRVFISES